MPGHRKSKRALPVDDLDEYEFSEPLENFIPGATTSTSAVNAPIPAMVERTSADGRRTYTETLSVEPPSPIKHMRMETVPEVTPGDGMDLGDDPPLLSLPTFDSSFESDLDSERYHMDLGAVFDRPVMPLRARAKKGRLKPSVSFCETVQERLNELTRFKGQIDARMAGPS